MLEECSQLSKRIDRARENGSSISLSHKDRIALQKADLTSDQRAEEASIRKTETADKPRMTEAIKSAPTISLQKLLGFSNWLNWTDQCRHLLEHISHDNTKCTIVMNSLSCKEDRKFLRGETKFTAVMTYLKQKYDRPSELVSHVLAVGANLLQLKMTP